MQRNYRQITPTHTTRTSKAGNSANTQEKGGVAEFEPALTMQQLADSEDGLKAMETRRRITLAVLTKTQTELTNSAAQAPESMLSMLEEVGLYLTHLNDMREATEAAQARLFTAMIEVHGTGNEGG